jgi:TonB family protein
MKTLVRQGALFVLPLAAIIAFLPSHSAAQDAGAARKVVSKIPPVYPTLARTMNIHGVVRVEAQVEPNGTVKSVDVKGGHPLLTQSAVTAVGHWKFEPASHETRELIELKFDPE